MTTLWPHQTAAADLLELQGRGMLAIDMGGGKTLTALELLRRWQCRRVLVLAPKSVVRVWPQEFCKHLGSDWWVEPLDSGSTQERAQVLRSGFICAVVDLRPYCAVMNYEATIHGAMPSTLSSLQWDALVLDECLPAGTPIATPFGYRRIEELRVGDSVLGYDHFGGGVVETAVEDTYQRFTYEHLVTVAGVPMTPGHPVWTKERGYEFARKVSRADYLVGRLESNDAGDHLRVVRQDYRDPAAPQALLRQVMLSQVEGATATVQGSVLRREEIRLRCEDAPAECGPTVPGEPTAVPWLRPQSVPRPSEASGDGAEGVQQACCGWVAPPARGQRSRTDSTPEDAVRSSGMGYGVCGPVRCSAGWVPDCLQDRLGQSGCHGRRGGGWYEPHGRGQEVRGREEGSIPVEPGMDDHPGAECRSTGGPGWCGPSYPVGLPVFNIRTGTRNYFADGLLVHNCHRIKQPTGKVSRLVGTLATAIPHVLGLTGTPMPHSPLDIWAQFRAIAPAVLPRSFWAFRSRYAIMGGYQGKQVTGYQNLPELQARLAPYTYRVRTDDVLTFPDAVDEHRYCLLGPKAQRVYHDLERDLVARIGDGVVTASNALTLLLRLAQVANGFCPDADTGKLRQLGTEKADLLRDLLEDLPDGEPLVVFGRFVEDLETIARVARATDRTCAELSGRRNQLALWQEGHADVLAVQLRAGGLGVDFTRARVQVYFALDYSLGDYLQTRARIRRPGQSRSVTYVHLLAAGTVDEKVATALAARQEVVGAVVDGLRRTQPQEVMA